MFVDSPGAGAASGLLSGLPKLIAGLEATLTTGTAVAAAVLGILPKLNAEEGAVVAGVVLQPKLAAWAAGTGAEAPAVVAGAESWSLAPSGVRAAPVGVEPIPPEVAAAAGTAEVAAAAWVPAVAKVKVGVLLAALGGSVAVTAVGNPSRLGTLGGPE